MTYDLWQADVPDEMKCDAVWTLAAYRKALFLSDLAWPDATKLLKDHRTISTSDQLYRAVGSIGANTAEGYSRGSARDRVRFYEYALGSARESRDWYFKGRHVLGQNVFDHRAKLPGELIRLLLTMIRQQRPKK